MQVDLFGNLIVEEIVETPKIAKKNPFDYIKYIGDKKYPDDFSGYNAWLTNAGFSQRKDTIFYANEINKYHQLGDREQFDFYYHSLAKKQYFAKWAKGVKSDNTDAIMAYYNVGNHEAIEYEKVLKKEQIESIKDWYSTREGGRC